MFNQLKGQECVKYALRAILDKHGKTMPHLLFYGNPGTGKTLAIKLLLKGLYDNLDSENILYLRSNDELGITTVRTKIKYFSQKMTKTENNINMKIVVIEAADSMTSAAQAALRRIMEIKSNITRFCMTCTDYTKIINPIASRCVTFRFKPLPVKIIREWICNEIENLQLNVDNKNLEYMVNEARGDLRFAQIIFETFTQTDLTFDPPIIHCMSKKIIQTIQKSDISSFIQVMAEVESLCLSSMAILRNIVTMLMSDPKVSRRLKNSISMHAIEADIQLKHGNDHPSFLRNCVMQLMT